MYYYKWADEDGVLGDGTTYVETSGGWTIRQITVSGDLIHASNVSYPRWGPIMGDQQADYDQIEEVTRISKREFDNVWNGHLERRRQLWENTKASFPLESRVAGYIERFFPQGVIVNLGQGALGVADCEECLASTSIENMYSKHKIDVTVIGYDEDYQWLTLGSPQVLGERLTLTEMDQLRA